MNHQSRRGRVLRVAAASAILVSVVTVGAASTDSSALTIGGATTTLVINAPTDRDGIAEFGQQLLVLGNGNYLITDPGYDTPTQLDVGAAFLYNGLTNEVISTLTGSNTNDRVGMALTEVGTSNVVVHSMFWNDGRGAATWVDGSTGLNDVVSAANSLVGSNPNDIAGSACNEAEPFVNENEIALVTCVWRIRRVVAPGSPFTEPPQ